ncbi:alcohol dehydrogenase catalytic domain-containing protein [Halomarina halobia]|uniref:Alcohol dehydrogenase catalytic domain-containing protein n=1 Tax=Halomarina halobia TaxID=3033386 RepID=A0ABD6AEZ1_9EURY|nr:alcohol dehydrogenase catalytic domain-containing protein [Halomarina sp. PSR21]
MRVAAFTSYDSPSDIEVQTHADPTPERGEAVVAVHAASLNHRDLWKLKDERRTDRQELPFVPGSDLAGIVERTGEGVTGVEEGDRVVLCPLRTCGTCRFCREGPENVCSHYDIYDGAFAERVTVDADRLVVLPDSVGFAAAAALPVAYMTAYRMLARGNATVDDRVFVPGATGGVGLAAVQLANLIGAETIGTSSSGEKLARVERAGLTHAVQTGAPEEMHAAVEAIGEVDVTINHLGGPFTRVGVDVLRRGGRMVVCGRTAGRYPDFDARDLYLGHKRIIGSTLGTQTDLERLVAYVADGRLRPVVGKQYQLAGTREAFDDMADRQLVGKLVVRPHE